MTRGTTPVLTFTTEYEASEISYGYVSFRQAGRVILEKALFDDGVEVLDREIRVRLSQEDTLLFSSNSVDIAEGQIRCILNNGDAIATPIISFYIGAIIKEGVI